MEQEALLKAIAAAPDDDLPRLVYADWLDEHDNPARAEFIRTQISLASDQDEAGGRSRTPEDKAKLIHRSAELLRQNQADWEAPLRRHFGKGIDRVLFRRGFPERFRLTGAAVRRLSGLLELPGVIPLELDLRGATLSDTDLRSLAKLTSLGSLYLTGSNVGDADLRHLTGLRNLELLVVVNTGVTGAGLRTLAESPDLAPGLQIFTNEGLINLGALRQRPGADPSGLYLPPDQCWSRLVRTLRTASDQSQSPGGDGHGRA